MVLKAVRLGELSKGNITREEKKVMDQTSELLTTATLSHHRRRRGPQRTRWLDAITVSMVMGLGRLQKLLLDIGGERGDRG